MDVNSSSDIFLCFLCHLSFNFVYVSFCRVLQLHSVPCMSLPAASVFHVVLRISLAEMIQLLLQTF